MEYKLSEVIDRFKPYGNENNDNLSFNLIDEENGTKTLHIKNVVFYDKDREGTVKADLVLHNLNNVNIDKTNNEPLFNYENNEKKLFEIYLDGEKWE